MITGTPGMSGSTSRTPQITPRMPMNGLMSPTRRARSGQHHEQERDRHGPGQAEARDEAVLSILVSSSARTSPGSPRIGAPSTKSEATSSWESAPST